LKHNQSIIKSIANYFFLPVSPANYHQLSVRNDGILMLPIIYLHQIQLLNHFLFLLH